MDPPHKEKTPHPDQLGGETGKRGGANPEGRQRDHSPKARRAVRFAAQGQAQRLLVAHARATFPGKFVSDVYRTAACLWSKIADVTVNHSTEFGMAHYAGLVTCGSVWACPTCAAKIQERRRLEIELAMHWAEAQALQAMMPTFTFPHRAFHTLQELLDRQAEAFRLLRKTRGYCRLMKSIGFRGLIRGLEVTHGPNGWHPHTHELWFVSPEATANIRDDLAQLWLRACMTAGLVAEGDDHAAFLEHSVHVQVNTTTGDYLAKQDDSRNWGFSHEVAKASSKAGRAKGVHPHHFLVRRAGGDDERFLEYVQGMKGRRQLFWSQGLKALAGVGEKTDEQIAEELVAKAVLVYTMPRGAWEYVRGNDARAEVLDAAEQGGKPAIQALLSCLGFIEEATHEAVTR